MSSDIERPDIRVRLAGPEDAQQLCQLYVELADGRVDALPAGPDEVRRLVEELCTEAGRRLLVAELEDGQLGGTADVTIVTNLTHAGRPWAVVENMIVGSRHRRSGVGRALMDEAVRQARQAGCYKLQLMSGKHRVEAHEFYERVGFERAAEGFRVYFDPVP